MESVLLALGDSRRRRHSILEYPQFPDYLDLPVNVWLAYSEWLLGLFYFDLNILCIPVVHHRLSEFWWPFFFFPFFHIFPF